MLVQRLKRLRVSVYIIAIAAVMGLVWACGSDAEPTPLPTAAPVAAGTPTEAAWHNGTEVLMLPVDEEVDPTTPAARVYIVGPDQCRDEGTDADVSKAQSHGHVGFPAPASGGHDHIVDLVAGSPEFVDGVRQVFFVLDASTNEAAAGPGLTSADSILKAVDEGTVILQTPGAFLKLPVHAGIVREC